MLKFRISNLKIPLKFKFLISVTEKCDNLEEKSHSFLHLKLFVYKSTTSSNPNILNSFYIIKHPTKNISIPFHSETKLQRKTQDQFLISKRYEIRFSRRLLFLIMKTMMMMESNLLAFYKELSVLTNIFF